MTEAIKLTKREERKAIRLELHENIATLNQRIEEAQKLMANMIQQTRVGREK